MNGKILVVSDLHIKNDDSIIDSLKLKVEEVNPTRIILLGDTFEVMVGNYPEYLKEHDSFFAWLKFLIIKGVIIHFVEGNHDFHLKEILTSVFKERFFYHEEGFFLGSIYFSHGDELDSKNYAHRIYRKLMKSRLMKFVANILGYTRVQSLASFLKKRSRGNRNPSQGYKEYFKLLAKKCFQEKKASALVLGHSHVFEAICENDLVYFNGGDPRKDRKMILIDEGKFSVVSF